MTVLSLALLVVAFVIFIIAAIGVPVPRVNLIAAGLACVVLSHILAGRAM